MIGKIERVPLREVWKNEAYDFTTWLQDNLDVLNGATGLNLLSAEREKAAGDFSVDLVCEDGAGGTVVVENQLERSDHDHLGKLITYLAAFSAKAAVWVVSQPRPEHVAAVAWLNESSSGTFYLLKAEAIRITSGDEGHSAPAPLMTLIVGPSAEAKEIGRTKIDIAERHHERLRFWTALQERARGRTRLHSNVTPGHDNWLGTSAGKSGLGLCYVVELARNRVELYIDRGINAADNEAIFDQFHRNRDAIEAEFGQPLSWERLEGKRACRIAARYENGGYRSPVEEWPALLDHMIDAMIRFERALRPHLAGLALPAQTAPADARLRDL
jgi:hypothetical protein